MIRILPKASLISFIHIAICNLDLSLKQRWIVVCGSIHYVIFLIRYWKPNTRLLHVQNVFHLYTNRAERHLCTCILKSMWCLMLLYAELQVCKPDANIQYYFVTFYSIIWTCSTFWQSSLEKIRLDVLC